MTPFFFFFFIVLPLYRYQPISLHPRAHMLSHVTPWTAVPQAPLAMDFSRQEYWSGLPFPSPSCDSFFTDFLSSLWWCPLGFTQPWDWCYLVLSLAFSLCEFIYPKASAPTYMMLTPKSLSPTRISYISSCLLDISTLIPLWTCPEYNHYIFSITFTFTQVIILNSETLEVLP